MGYGTRATTSNNTINDALSTQTITQTHPHLTVPPHPPSDPQWKIHSPRCDVPTVTPLGQDQQTPKSMCDDLGLPWMGRAHGGDGWGSPVCGGISLKLLVLYLAVSNNAIAFTILSRPHKNRVFTARSVL